MLASVCHIHHNTRGVYLLFLNFSIIHTPVLASVCHIQHNTRGVCLLFFNFSIIHTPVLASVCHIQHNTRRLCWPLLSPRAYLHVVGMLQLMPWPKPTELAHSFLFRSCVLCSLYGPFNCISVHKFSRQLSAFSLCSSGLISALLVLSIIYLFTKVSPSPDIILCGWMG